MSVNVFNSNSDSAVKNLRWEVDNKITKISNPVGHQLVKTTESGELVETGHVRKHFCELTGDSFKNTSTAAVFSRPLRLQYNTKFIRFIVQVYTKTGQADRGKRLTLVFRFRGRPMEAGFDLGPGESYKVFECSYTIPKTSVMNLQLKVNGI